MPYEHDRAFYRVQYPPEAAPRYLEGGLAHRVVDCSEGGFRYAPRDGVAPAPGGATSGVIEFPGGETVDVVGTIVRIQNGEVAVNCAGRPIPLAIILTEQRRLRAHYPFRAEP
jgi:hypothetical protein